MKEATGEARWGLACILLFFIGSAILLFFVDTKKGGLEAKNFHVAAEVQIDELVAANPGLKVDDDAELSERQLESKLRRKRTLTASKRSESLLANEQPELPAPAPEREPAAKKKKKRAATASGTAARAREPQARPDAQSERLESAEDAAAKQDLPSVPLDG